MITIPSSITRGEAATFSIDKDLIAAEFSDPYFQDTANWREAQLIYHSLIGNQFVRVDINLTTEQGTAVFPLNCRDDFYLSKVIVYDVANGFDSLLRANIPSAASYDISLAVVSLSSIIAWTRVNPSVIQFSGADGGLIGGNSDWEQGASNGPEITGDFTLEYRVIGVSDIRMGYQKSATPPSAAANPDSGIRIQNSGVGNTFGPMAVVGSRYDVSSVTEKSFKFIRVGSVISLSINSDTPTVFESFSGSIYPHVAIFTTSSGGSLTYAKKS